MIWINAWPSHCPGWRGMIHSWFLHLISGPMPWMPFYLVMAQWPSLWPMFTCWPALELLDQCSLTSTWVLACNTPGVLNTKIGHVIICIAKHCSYCKLWYAFTKTSLHLCYECCIVWFESSSKFCLDLDFRKPWFPVICFTPKNLIQNQGTFWRWALKQKM